MIISNDQVDNYIDPNVWDLWLWLWYKKPKWVSFLPSQQEQQQNNSSKPPESSQIF